MSPVTKGGVFAVLVLLLSVGVVMVRNDIVSSKKTQPLRPALARTSATQTVSATEPPKAYPVKTTRDCSYITIDLGLGGVDPIGPRHDVILDALAKFGKDHPELKINSRQVIYGEPDYFPGRIDGILVCHEPKGSQK